MRPARLATLTLAILFVASADSAQRVERVIDGHTIVVQGVGTGRYGRTLACVYMPDGTFLND
jgi:endonuclease YncB( thermonuclease family)